MTSNFFSKNLPIIINDNSTVGINGSDGESKAAADLLLATRGEVKWSSREVDGRKIDLEFSIAHPWYDKDNLALGIQVKSGESYVCATKGDGFVPTSSVFKDVQRVSEKIGLIWVDPKSGDAYWALIRPNSKYIKTGYGIHHRLTPATIYDLARCCGRDMNGNRHGRGVSLSAMPTNLSDLRLKACKSYKKYKSVSSPVLGDIKITRYGWSHMFRKSRHSNYKKTSLRVIPILGSLLKQIPTEHVIRATHYFTKQNFEYRECEHVLTFTQIKDSNNQNINVRVKIIEQIRYPNNWRERGYLTQLVQRESRLLSAYIK